jgi:hypothetical protein
MSEKAVCKVPGRSALTEIKCARKRMGRNCFLDVEWTKLFVGWPVAKMIVQAVCQNIGGQNQIRVFCGWLYDAVPDSYRRWASLKLQGYAPFSYF